MNDHRYEPDLAAVRDLADRAHRPGPEAPALARTWNRVTAGLAADRGLTDGGLPGDAGPDGRRGRQRRPRWGGLAGAGPRWGPILVPVAVGAAVVALIVGAVALLGPNGGPNGGPTGGVRVQPGAMPGGGSADPSAPAPAAVLGQPTSVAAAWSALIAAGGGAAPATLVPGELIYTCTNGVVNDGLPVNATPGSDPSRAPDRWEWQFGQVWLDPQGAIPVMIKVNGEPMMFTDSPKDNSAQQIADARARLAQDGPSLLQPTPQWLATLPTTPDAMLSFLRAEVSSGGRTKWSVDHDVWEMAADLLHTADGLLPTAQRTALYGALSQMDGLSAYTLNAHGHQYYSIRRSEGSRATGLIFDPATGRSAGREDANLDGSGAATVSYQALSCWAVVAAVGETS